MIRAFYFFFLIMLIDAPGYAKNPPVIEFRTTDTKPTPVLLNENDGTFYNVRLTNLGFVLTSLSMSDEVKSLTVPFGELNSRPGFQIHTATLEIFFTANGDIALMGEGLASVPGGSRFIPKTMIRIGILVSGDLSSGGPLDHNFLRSKGKIIRSKYIPERDIYVRYIYFGPQEKLRIHAWHLNEGSHKNNPPYIKADLKVLAITNSKIVVALEERENEKNVLTIYSLSTSKHFRTLRWGSKAVAAVEGPANGPSLLSELKLGKSQDPELSGVVNVYFQGRHRFDIENGRIVASNQCALPFAG